MSSLTGDRDSENATACSIAAEGVGKQDSRLHTGPGARLLARVSKWSDEYTNYQMDSCTWRKLSL